MENETKNNLMITAGVIGAIGTLMFVSQPGEDAPVIKFASFAVASDPRQQEKYEDRPINYILNEKKEVTLEEMRRRRAEHMNNHLNHQISMMSRVYRAGDGKACYSGQYGRLSCVNEG